MRPASQAAFVLDCGYPVGRILGAIAHDGPAQIIRRMKPGRSVERGSARNIESGIYVSHVPGYAT